MDGGADQGEGAWARAAGVGECGGAMNITRTRTLPRPAPTGESGARRWPVKAPAPGGPGCDTKDVSLTATQQLYIVKFPLAHDTAGRHERLARDSFVRVNALGKHLKKQSKI